MVKSQKIYSVPRVLTVLYELIVIESKNDHGEILKKMNQTKNNILELIQSLKKSGHFYKSISLKDVKMVPQILDYDDLKGYSIKREIGQCIANPNFLKKFTFGKFLQSLYYFIERDRDNFSSDQKKSVKQILKLIANISCDIHNLALGNSWFSRGKNRKQIINLESL